MFELKTIIFVLQFSERILYRCCVWALQCCISLFNVQYNFNFIFVKLYLYDYNKIMTYLVRYPSAFCCSNNCIVPSTFVYINYTIYCYFLNYYIHYYYPIVLGIENKIHYKKKLFYLKHHMN